MDLRLEHAEQDFGSAFANLLTVLIDARQGYAKRRIVVKVAATDDSNVFFTGSRATARDICDTFPPSC
jgi:hypothetical protein